ncbi:undecaprenyldiphospho-muramoylpentapeptide beta-N-acetylglucosaminyltransferase [Paraferrimonas sedimenticola]|uniref:UDP-N-acetylglucosamine--N-acetylmuramyl-(pentapeptide) pyrophosphoryl-undecaprenol N-acetylglucosamine transferase n=1 Tax=Paraferrimonas sedimenticola TaxID=375674 RepID=A0AA37RYT2_9GAMM|nr:undecaprenyldiphospho-muramoylpentapeptide beta-N-acetylglucosaminyltransferase [Paraferrimonas sedimenticola]GLP97499.1 UDP-N-acetylglucosamine--N-acetylmuramyl-(pentapeptide) pyrophosphoryl-undecaprenol N-acetylglucosamine transferase [Paraferrimonas sedimenticola]
MSQAKRLLVMAGGTGGHVFPALAVAQHLRSQGWQVRWLGTPDRMEARLVPQYGFDIDYIDIQGVRGNGLVRKLAAPFKIIKAMLQARRVIKSFKPDVVMGMGGFASGPGGVAAKWCGVPLVLHEQNALPGLTNKLLSRIADKVLCAFNGAFDQVDAQVVGNPVRPELVELGEQSRLVELPLKLLVVGGSLGARVFNQEVPGAVAALTAQGIGLTVWHQVGKGNSADVEQAYREKGCAELAQVADFVDDMRAAYDWADLVLCRSGALTVSELAAVGKPSLLVPYPHAVDDHQTKNAMVLVNAGAAKLIAQPDLSQQALVDKITKMHASPDALTQMGRAARSVAHLDATTVVAGVCQQLADREQS